MLPKRCQSVRKLELSQVATPKKFGFGIIPTRLSLDFSRYFCVIQSGFYGQNRGCFSAVHRVRCFFVSKSYQGSTIEFGFFLQLL